MCQCHFTMSDIQSGWCGMLCVLYSDMWRFGRPYCMCQCLFTMQNIQTGWCGINVISSCHTSRLDDVVCCVYSTVTWWRFVRPCVNVISQCQTSSLDDVVCFVYSTVTWWRFGRPCVRTLRSRRPWSPRCWRCYTRVCRMKRGPTMRKPSEQPLVYPWQ